jgi:hypothetical protein
LDHKADYEAADLDVVQLTGVIDGAAADRGSSAHCGGYAA